MTCAMCHADATGSPHTLTGCLGSQSVLVKVCEDCWRALSVQVLGGLSIAGEDIP